MANFGKRVIDANNNQKNAETNNFNCGNFDSYEQGKYKSRGEQPKAPKR